MSTARLPHGKRRELFFIDYMEERLEPDQPLRPYLLMFEQDYQVHRVVSRRWWNHYLFWGESPSETKSKMKKLNKLAKKYKATSIITESIVQTLKEIVDEKPELYLDEIAVELIVRKDCYLCLATIANTLKTRLDYSLQVYAETAIQRDETERIRYKEALNALVTDVGQVVFIDETHKDRNTSRRRRGWGARNRNTGGLTMRRWFRSNIRYTLIAAMDIDGFIPSTLEIVRRDELSDEGAAGTIDSTHFESWVEHFLLPKLGRFEYGEKRSIVIMDNASTHMRSKVKELINGVGAYLLYTAPYSPDLNPIELAFGEYKKSLKRDYELASFDWYQAHLNAIESSKDTCIKQFRKCGVPLSNEILTEEEEENRRRENAILFLFLFNFNNLIINKIEK